MRRSMILVGLLSVSALVAASSGHFVEQKNKTFSTKNLKIKAGDTVTFRNDDPFFHYVFSLSEGHAFELGSLPAKVKPEEMKLAKQVISSFESELNLKDYKDEYKEGLRKIIEAKIAGEEVVAPEIQEPPKVVDLMEALRRSLDSVSSDKKKPAKADIAKPVAKAKAASGKKRKAS